MQKLASPQFTNFIATQLSFVGLNKRHIQLYTNDENIQDFRLVFVHSSADSKNNYEYYEFRGDTIVNDIIAEYVSEETKTRNVKWLTKIKHNLMSKKTLSSLAENLGFEEYLVYGEKMVESLTRNPDKKTNKDYRSMLEDCVEAFMGCLVIVVNRHSKNQVGHGVARMFLRQLMKRYIKIEMDYSKVFDPITRLKEIYDAYKWGFIKKGFKSTFVVTERKNAQEETAYDVEIFGFPYGDKTPIASNKAKLVTYRGDFGQAKDEVEYAAAERAILELSSKYRIYGKIEDMPI